MRIDEAFLSEERIITPRGSFRIANISEDCMKEMGYGYYFDTDDGQFVIVGNGKRAFAIRKEVKN
nr:hypothetical protein [uncultured Lachnoclostridium sp.]